MFYYTLFLLVAGGVASTLVSCAPVAHAATSVSNTATISATAGKDGVSTNKLRIHTEVNGEVIEAVDLTSSEPIQYRNQTTYDTGTTSFEAGSGTPDLPASARQARLQALLMQLLHYVSLLKQTLDAERTESR